MLSDYFKWTEIFDELIYLVYETQKLIFISNVYYEAKVFAYLFGCQLNHSARICNYHCTFVAQMLNIQYYI